MSGHEVKKVILEARSRMFRNIVTQVSHKLEIPKSLTWDGQERGHQKNYRQDSV